MKRGFGVRTVVYLIIISFLFMTNGFPKIVAEAKETDLPIGEMISNGMVKFEVRDKVWKEVEPSHFPVFRGTKLKVEKGIAAITLKNNARIEVGPNSQCSFDHTDRFVLTQGSFTFRIPVGSELDLKAGGLSILKSRTLQAATSASVPPQKDEETIGSVSIHSNGAISIKNIQGKFSILNENKVLLAALSAKDEVTIPSVGLSRDPKAVVAQVGGKEAGGTGASGSGGTGGGFLGISTWGWIAIGAGVLTLTGTGVGVYQNNKDDEPSWKNYPLTPTLPPSSPGCP